ncbi:AI-2E family transporter [Microlunatus elymi]|uniref:AI-2E family transporter n=1 Tax=Microlunatus elymi TaxID=2596828 RepID=A0A516Q1B9_9ACTN|nr:AI-2E family transporter [Microlunatus elymi]QDP97227.1 AI-2E family transporter [Microlunatus elymi]
MTNDEPAAPDEPTTPSVGQAVPPARAGMPRAAVLVIVPAALAICAVLLRELAWLFGPVTLALVIVILVHPIHSWLIRIGVPKAVALAGLMIAIFGLVLGLIAIIVLSLARLATILPSYIPAASQRLQGIIDLLRRLGVGSEQVREIIGSLDVTTAARFITSHLPTLISQGATAVLLCSLLLFLAMESAGIADRMKPILATRPRAGLALLDAVRKTRRFLAVTGFFAVVVGTLDVVLLWVIGVPLAPLWGLLAAACNFIPYVGFIIGVIPPALLALLGGGWDQMVFVIIAYIVLNSIFTTLVPAKVVGNAVGVAVPVTFVAVVFWAWVLGPLGSILAIPLTLFVKSALIDSDPRAAWLSGFFDAPEGRLAKRRRSQDAAAARQHSGADVVPPANGTNEVAAESE